MPSECIPLIEAFVLAYSAFASAGLLIGADRNRLLCLVLLPSALAALSRYLQNTAFVCIPLMLCLISFFFATLKLTDRNLCVALIALLMASGFMLLFQLAGKALQPTDAQALLFSLAALLLPLMLWLSKIVIFRENTLLTRDQRKSVLRRMLYFFPGPVLLIVLQVYLLSAQIDNLIFPAIFALLFQLMVLLQLRAQAQSLQEQLENVLDKQYQAELLSFMQVIRSQRHDFNFHIQTICSMIENDAFSECRDYVRSMMATVSSTNEILPLYHPATSALLNTFREISFQKGLRMDVEIHDNLQFIAASVFETNTILGNLLQNAVDELELHPENESRVIGLLIIKRGQYNVIKVSNQCHLSPEEMKSIFMPGFTTKKSHEGLGLANALRVAEKYGGTLYPEFEGKTVHFIARIPLKNYPQY